MSDLTFAGLIATGTHATGLSHKILASMVKEIEFVNGVGEILSTSESLSPSLFKAMLCSLGALGIITKMTIKCERAFNLECFEELKSFDWV